MAQDPDVIKVAGLYETRGRRSKSQKARTLTETLKGFEATAKGLTRSLDFALPLGLFAFTAWTTKLRIEARPGVTSLLISDPTRTRSVYVSVTYRGREVFEMTFSHPDLYAAEGMGMLTILMSMPGSDILGLVENGLALGLYHIFLNGANFPIPMGTTAIKPSPLGPVFDILNLLFQLTPVSATTLELKGLFPTLRWNPYEMQVNIQRAVDAGTLTLPVAVPVGNTPMAIDPFVRRLQIDSVVKSLAHSAFLTLLLKRGGGVVPTE